MFPFQDQPPVIAVPDWPHASPLVAGLDRRGDISIRTMPVTEIAAALAGMSCACGLISPTLLLSNPALSVLPGAGLAAHGCSPSERLVSIEPLEAIRRVQAPPGTEMLVPLVKVVFAERGLPLPEFTSGTVPSTGGGGALLVSGASGGGMEGPGHDLGTLWRETTGLPLVLGVWACSGMAPFRMLRQVLGEAARLGEEGLARDAAHGRAYYYRLLSEESDSVRALHALARRHAIGGASVESIVFC